jgi:peroxiredoxin
MIGLGVGERAPSFRLPSAQGPIVALDDVRARASVILWFTKGFACPFCRQQMSHLLRSLPRFRELDGEAITITRTPLARAQMYARHFPLAMPYLSDSDGAVRRAYRLDVRPKPVTWYVRKLLRLRHAVYPPSDFGPSGRLGNPARVRTTPRELVATFADEDTALFVVDKAGIVRFAKAGGMRADGGLGAVWQLPSIDEIVGVLREVSPSPR